MCFAGGGEAKSSQKLADLLIIFLLSFKTQRFQDLELFAALLAHLLRFTKLDSIAAAAARRRASKRKLLKMQRWSFVHIAKNSGGHTKHTATDQNVGNEIKD